MTSIAEALTYAKHHLANANSDEVNVDARLLLQHVLQCSSAYLFTYPERALSASQEAQYVALVERRKEGEPIAYIIGHREFWGLSLAVSPATLIPRPETELLVETALDIIDVVDATVLDLGTGTGAIALAIASERSSWQVAGVDRVAAAIALAEKNRIALTIPNARFHVSDWFTAVGNHQFNLIVSNPPYVEVDSEYLTQGDLRFEPASALVSENHGLNDIFKIIDNSPNYLANQGWLMLEHGSTQADIITAYLKDRGFKSVETRCDIQQHPRVTLGCWSN